MLTGLPNRLLLEEPVDGEIATAERTGSMLGILVIDFDNFKSVNDMFGHAAGDRYLIEVATRLRAALRHKDVLFRAGGDEFIAVVPGMDTMAGVEALVDRLITAVREPIAVDGHVESPAVSIGAALYPQDGRTFSNLLAVADQALYSAKARGGNQYCLPSRPFEATEDPTVPGVDASFAPHPYRRGT